MSWDVFIMRFPPEAVSVRDVPSKWMPEPMGTVETVRGVIDRIIPAMRWDESGRGDGTGAGFSVNASLGNRDDDEDRVHGITLMFYGGGSAAHVSIAIAEALSARAIGGGEFLDSANADGLYADWQRYRDQVTGRRGTELP
jgi:hypothetical protein